MITPARYMRALLVDPEIPSGLPIAVAIAIAGKLRWGNSSSPIPIRTIATRLNVEVSYVSDVVYLLCAVDFLREVAPRRDRKMYTAVLPARAMIEPPVKDAA